MSAHSIENMVTTAEKNITSGLSGATAMLADHEHSLKVFAERTLGTGGAVLPGLIITGSPEGGSVGSYVNKPDTGRSIFKSTDPISSDAPLPLLSGLNGGDGTNPWTQPVFESRGVGIASKMVTETPGQKLWDKEYNKLSPAEKTAYNSENQAAIAYQQQLETWKIEGSHGQPPVKPNIPMHDQVSAAVNADEKQIESNVRAEMGPVNCAILDAALSAYQKARQDGLNVPLPQEIIAYNNAIAKAAGIEQPQESKWSNLALTISRPETSASL